MRRLTTTVLSLAVVLVSALGVCSPASAASPWWHLTSGARPTVLEPESSGELILTATNLGDAPADGAASPILISDQLPAGLEAKAITAVAGFGELESFGPVNCSLAKLTCSFPAALPAYTQIEVRIKFHLKPTAETGELNRVSVSGGLAAPASLSRPLTIGSEPSPFGLEEYGMVPEEEGGAGLTAAGSHPFQLTTSLVFNQRPATHRKGGTYIAQPVALAKDVAVKLPPGLVGNPSPFPRCTLVQFNTVPPFSSEGAAANLCPPQSAVGVAVVTFDEPSLTGLRTQTVPIFNLEPTTGEPARFGFQLLVSPVLIDTSLRDGNGEDYGVTVSSTNISQVASLISSKLIFWGVPGDPRHDQSRGWRCLDASLGTGLNIPCLPAHESHPPALLTLPASCSGPLQTSAETDSWLAPGELTSSLSDPPLPTLDGCNQTLFAPTIAAQPSTDRASAPSGLDFNLNFHDEGLTSGTGIAQSQLKDTVVTLPEGFTINPSAGVGLAGCTQADYARETLDSAPGAGCPSESKLGTVEVTTPLLSTPIHGSLYIAQPYENPFGEPQAGHPNGTLVALYVVLKDPETGVLIKLAGKVTPDPVTGRLTTTFDNNPQLPFDRFNFHFREGQQAPLISPPACGTYTTQAQLTPWSEPTTSLSETSSFTITAGYDGGACPAGGVPPFKPGITAGTLNNNAGAFTPFYLHLSRTDGEQEITGFSTDMPSGLTGDLTGIPFCPEADIEAARAKAGAQEQAAPSCPASSLIGHTLVGTGVGAVLAYVPGKVYLAGPFHGAPFSIVSVTSATVGPFDLGTVVLRFGLNIDPNTAQVSVSPTSSEPIPTILHGIVTHVRDIRVYVDRAGFILNPTSCNPLQISSTLNGDVGGSATVSSPFQAANCTNLAFKPSFKVSTAGKTSRQNGASLTVKLTYPTGALGKDANIRSVKVNLPKQLPSRLTTLQEACTDSVFNANPAACPAASRVGQARAVTPILPVPLTGPAYFVSHGGAKFPELIVVLQGYGVTIDLHGETFISKAGITSSTFRTVPDQPVTSFELTLPQGPNSALAAPSNLCKATLKMPTTFTAQNGMVIKQTTPISVTGCARHKKVHKASKHRKGGKKK
jgi:hypothetical protein